MSDVPAEAKQLLATSPENFVEDRKRVARELREADRAEDARLVEGLRKPPAVVLAVNRAARDRPQAARDAVAAAQRLAETQLSGDTDAYRATLKDLEAALSLLAEVAVAQLSRTKPANEAMRRRVADLLRASAADADGRDALAQGVLQEEIDAAGFTAFAGMAPAPRSKDRPAAKSAEKRRETAKREKEERLQAELEGAEEALETAEASLAAAQRDRDKAARQRDAIAERLERLRRQ